MSLGTSKGSLMNPSALHLPENEEEGAMAETKAISDENDATATVKVSSVVQVAADISSGHEIVWRHRKKLESQRDIV